MGKHSLTDLKEVFKESSNNSNEAKVDAEVYVAANSKKYSNGTPSDAEHDKTDGVEFVGTAVDTTVIDDGGQDEVNPPDGGLQVGSTTRQN